MFFTDWGRFTIITVCLGVVFLFAAGYFYMYNRKAKAARDLFARVAAAATGGEQEQAQTEGHAMGLPVGHEDTEEEDEVSDFSSMPAYYEQSRAKHYSNLGRK